MLLVDYGPIKRRDVSMGAGLDSLCTEADGFAAADTVIGNPSSPSEKHRWWVTGV